MASINTLFDAKTPNVYTMPSGAPFLKHLAAGLKASLGDSLPSAMVLLPTRRAVRELTDAFLDLQHGKASLLPLMRTLADMDENEPPFVLGAADIDVPPAIDMAQHNFELAQLIAQKMKSGGEEVDAASALAMSEPLASLLSDFEMEELGAGALSVLDDDLQMLPDHFQNAAEFVKIVTRFWPARLKELGLSSPAARRVALLNAAAKLWQESPPDHPVIVAGSTGTLAATARVIKSVAAMKRGLVALPGLDIHIDDEVWKNIDDQHPQASLKKLLSVLNLKRSEIQEWPDVRLPYKAIMRARILAESLIPADATSDWPQRIARVQKSKTGGNSLQEGLEGLSLIETRTEEEEAAVIALIMRETLEAPRKTCALITPDPSLARRVRAKLSRWNVNVDSSAGEPLEETLHGSFLALCAEAALDPFDFVTLSALVKHKLFSHENTGRQNWDMLEKQVLRGPKPRTLEAIKARLSEKCKPGFALLKSIHKNLVPLGKLYTKGASVSATTTAHTILLEKFSQNPQAVWNGEAGEKAATLLEELIVYGDALPDVDGRAYLRLLSIMMRGRVVRPRYGTEERIHILGPLEARMFEADTFVLGGLNEGVWPVPPAPHPVLSRRMRLKTGLTAPERRFGLAAHDFAQLAAKPKVILTRAQRSADGPTVQSRWLWRLQTLASGAKKEDILKTRKHYLDWARTLDRAPDKPVPAVRPAPRPPLSARWARERRLSVTQVQTWIRDPYAIYAKKVLRLNELYELDQPLGGQDYGSAVHKALETIDTVNEAALAELLKQELQAAGYEPHTFSRNAVRIEGMATWLTAWARQRQDEGWTPRGIEKKGAVDIEMKKGVFTLSGIADRIEQRGTEIAIMDYKTGAFSSDKVVQAGFDPQLPLLAIMLTQGKLGMAGQVSDLLYVNPKAKKEKSILTKGYTAETYETEALELLQNLIAHFDNENTAYYSQPRAQYVNPYGDYDHLARRAEWAVLGGEDKS